MGYGYALENKLLMKQGFTVSKTNIPEHIVVHCSPTCMPVGFIGQYGMKSARPWQGVAVVGACKEKGGSSRLPLSLPLACPLFCSPCFL